MIDEIRALLDGYSTWVRDKTVLRELGERQIEITTPFLDRNNDQLQIYARKVADGFVLSDEGETIAELRLSGCDLDSPRRSEILKQATHGFAVRVVNEALEVNATAENFALRKHNLVQAMLAVNDLFYMSSPNVVSLFREDVATWLRVSEVRYVPDVRFRGKTGFDQHFDFAIPASQTEPERLVNALANPNKQSASSLILAWEDIREIRGVTGSKCVAILNDNEKAVRREIVSALRNYDIEPIQWHLRAENVLALQG